MGIFRIYLPQDYRDWVLVQAYGGLLSRAWLTVIIWALPWEKKFFTQPFLSRYCYLSPRFAGCAVRIYIINLPYVRQHSVTLHKQDRTLQESENTRCFVLYLKPDSLIPAARYGYCTMNRVDVCTCTATPLTQPIYKFINLQG